MLRRLLLLVPIPFAAITGCPNFPVSSEICDVTACFSDASTDGPNFDAPPGCDLTKDPKDSPACVDESVGIFVSPTGDDSNAGTSALPLKTVGAALAKAVQSGRSRLYLCEGTYHEDIRLDVAHDGISLYGGLSCSDWKFTGTRPQIGATAEPLRIVSLTKPIVLSDLEILAADAISGSSVGVHIARSTVTASRLRVVAGKGAVGATGELTKVTFPTAEALKGKDATDANTGGPATRVDCAAGGFSIGGKGGNIGFSGDPGKPDGGDAGVLGPNCSTGIGADGPASSAGPNGAGASRLGMLSVNGWVPENGQAGTHGSPGAGGGGGAGIGGAGGGGGAGGCGGAGGGAGGGGGASVGLSSFEALVTIQASEIVAGIAGSGGSGHAGQEGQTAGGTHGNGSGCQGGNGGGGASGGAGGGGAGGLSVGLLYRGERPIVSPDTKLSAAEHGGSAGPGGAPGVNDGVPGDAKSELQAP